MLKKALTLSLLVFILSTLNAQVKPNELLHGINVQNQNGMLVLGAWSVSNIVTGSILSSKLKDESKYFWQMNAAWNTVNLTIATFGYFGKTQNGESISNILKIIDNYKLAYLFNAGLDIGYIMTGFYLNELSNRKVKHASRLSGYGQSLILQGSFLFLFDIAMFTINQRHFNVTVSPWIDTFNTTTGLSLSYTF